MLLQFAVKLKVHKFGYLCLFLKLLAVHFKLLYFFFLILCSHGPLPRSPHCTVSNCMQNRAAWLYKPMCGCLQLCHWHVAPLRILIRVDANAVSSYFPGKPEISPSFPCPTLQPVTPTHSGKLLLLPVVV